MVESSEHDGFLLYRFADIVIDTARRRVERGNEIIELPRLSYRMLLTLAKMAPRVLTYDDLVDAVWDGRLASPETVKQRVKLLRDALSDDAADPRYIGLVRGQGYRLLPDVTPIDGVTGDAADGGAAPARWVKPGIALALLLAAAAAGLFRHSEPGSGRAPVVAVLPFVDAYGDDGAYVADGLSHSLIAELGRVEGLDVLSGRSSHRFRDRDTPLPEIAAQLDAELLVDGSVSRHDSAFVVAVQLIEPDSGRSLWDRTFDLAIEDVPRVPAAVADAVASSFGLASPGDRRRRDGLERPVSPASYEAYLRGMYSLNKGTPEGTEEGLAYLHDAVDKDPGDAFAYAGLALGYATYGQGFEPRHDVWPRARAAALRALKLDPQLAEAHAALADVKLYSEWDWDGAEASFRRANELNPSLAMNHYHHAWYLVLFRRFDEAIAEHRRAQQLDPLNPLHTYWLGGLYLYQDFGRYREAIEVVNTALAMDPDNPAALLVLGLAQSAGGMHDEAIATVEKAARISAAVRAPLGLIYDVAGRKDAARSILAELDAAPTTPWRAYWKFVLNARLGDLDKAFEWLAYEPHHAFVPWVRVDPWVRHLIEDDPRFPEFLERVGLEP